MLHSLRLALNGRIPPAAKSAYLKLRELNAGQRALPDFLIIGAQKAGTTSLFNYLCQHPQVIGSVPKELFYFCSHPERGERWYRRHFPLVSTLKARSALCGEATPTSLYSEQAAQLARQLVPQAKIIVLLREPAARAVSHYYHQVRFGVETRSIDEVFSIENIQRWRQGDCPDLPWRWYFKWSDYATGSKYWDECYPSEQILILQAEDMFADPQKIYDQVTSFLGIHSQQLPDAKAFNAGASQKKLPAAYDDLREVMAHQEAWR